MRETMKKTSLATLIFEDFRHNSHIKSKFILLLYRTAHSSGMTSHRALYLLFIPYRFFYRLIVDWILGVDIPWKVRIGRRVVLFHSFALVVNEGATLGDDCILRHGVTIGNKLAANGETSSPKVGNRVEFGAGCIVIGDLSVGDNSIIGAGAVVTKNVPANAVMVGNPARKLEPGHG
jgi:putative colanic acid biosynthesis acetyltransferase WcaB